METIAATHLGQTCLSDPLIVDLTSMLGAMEAPDIDGEIGSLLRRIADTIGVDCVTLVEYGEHGEAVNTYHWIDPSVSREPDGDAHASWLWERLCPDHGQLTIERIPADLSLQSVTPALVEHLRRMPLRSLAVIPNRIAGELNGALVLESMREYRAWPADVVERLQLATALLGAALHRRRQDFELRQVRADLKRLTRQIEREKEPFDDDPEVAEFEGIIGKSGALRMALARVQEVAPTSSTVLLLGETGTGKELFARAIHANGPRRANPLVSVNCAALPPTLIESELFGHARGAFTGAVAPRQGRFEVAHHGTLFLDEVGDLPLDLQAKLLRVLQEGAFERVGSSSTQKVDVRIIAATHRDLAKAVADGSFRDDLYYRLSVFPIRLPPLRQRREDIPALVWYLIHKRQRALQRWIKRVPENVMEALQQHDWPGNIRELENVIERALIHSTGDTLKLLDNHFDRVADAAAPAPDDTTLTAVERAHLEEVLRACRWRINGAGNAAERLGLHPNTLRFRMKKLGIVREVSASGTHVAHV